MDAIKNILGNEHLLIGVLLIIGATVLAAIGVMPRAEWESYSQIIFATAAGSHAIISVGDSLANAKASSNDMLSTFANGLSQALAAKSEATTADTAAKPPTEKV